MVAPAGQNQSADSGIVWFVIFVIVVLAAIFAVDRFAAELNSVRGALASVHVAPFAYLTKLFPWLSSIALPFGDAAAVYDFLARGRYAEMTSAQGAAVDRTAAFCAALIYMPAPIWIAVRAVRIRPDDVYTHRYDLQSMVEEQARTWWTGRLARTVNFLKERDFDLRFTADEVGRRRHAMQKTVDSLGPDALGSLLRPAPPAVAPPVWARSLRPEEWLVACGATYDEQEYSRLTGQADRTRPVKFTTESPALFDFQHRWTDISLETATELLSAELGPVWRGTPDGLPAHLRSVMAVCARFLAFDTAGGNRVLEELGALYECVCREPRGAFDRLLVEEPGFMDGIDGILADTPGQNLLGETAGHWYLYTACCRMLEVARTDRGVLAPASMLWLKAENRRLWYAFSAIGSDVSSIEGAAVIAHYRAERQYRSPIFRPALYQASRALVEDYLDLLPERVAARQAKAARSRTPGDTIRALFDHDDAAHEDLADARLDQAAVDQIRADIRAENHGPLTWLKRLMRRP